MVINRSLEQKINRLDLRELFHSRLFWFGVCLKVILGSMFASHYLTELFVPFINHFCKNPHLNPYEYFYSIASQNSFPYPAFMLYVMSLPRFIFTWGNSVGLSTLWVYRVPLILFDVLILVVLWRWMRGREDRRKVIYYYWLSPVLIYINYIHGQLDVIPVGMMFLSLYLLFRDRFLLSALALGAAISAKLHILLVVPFIFTYLIIQRVGFRTIIKATLVCLLTLMLINFPYLSSEAFYQLVANSSEQAKVFGLYLSNMNDQQAQLYILPSAYCLLLFNCLVRQSFNRDILIMYLGFAFGLLLFFIPPQQGWYFWILPYFAYFYSKEKGFAVLFLGLQLLYLLYFALRVDSDYFEVFQFMTYAPTSLPRDMIASLINSDPDWIQNITFTMLQTVLLLNCIWIYTRGISNYKKHGINVRPYLVGIGGDSGAGKTTLSRHLERVFKSTNTSVIHGDDMHRWERGHNMWDEYTHLNPKANYLHKEYNYLKVLKEGKTIARSQYDHANGRFTEKQITVAKKLVIFEGLLPYYLDKMRSVFNLKIFVRPDAKLAMHWKIIRDKDTRGYSADQVIDLIKKRESDRLKYIEPQAQHADIVVELLCQKEINNIGDEAENIDTYLRMRFKNSIYLDQLIEQIEKLPALNIHHYYDDEEYQFVECRGEVLQLDLVRIIHAQLPGFDEIGIYTPEWPSGYDGIILLFISYCIFENEGIENA